MERSCTSQTGDPTSRVNFSDSSFELNPLPEPIALGSIWSRKPSYPCPAERASLVLTKRIAASGNEIASCQKALLGHALID